MDASFTYSEITDDLQVEVDPAYIESRSQPKLGFFYAYTVKITNLGNEAYQLIGRHWIIRDGTGKEEQVRGDGVVGEKPFINPGETYQYTSACPLKTPTGNMRGAYIMQREDSSMFEVTIPLFFLRPPYTFQ